jgi:hypothetical protein
MRVIAYETARVTLLFPFEEVAPLGGADGVAIVQAVAQRYSFARPPDLSVSREEINKTGLKFEDGKFQFEGELVNINNLGVYNDGLNIDASTTERAEAFLNDLVGFLRSDFQFRGFTSHPRKFFWSQVVVEFERPLARLISGFEKFAFIINKTVASIYGPDTPLPNFARLDFEWDRTKNTAPNPVPRFYVERRLGVPFEQERYFCGAPMQTRDHLRVLEELERLTA